MTNRSVKEYVAHYVNKLNSVYELYDKGELRISFDKLRGEDSVDYELLYFENCSEKEKKGVFIFSYEYFLKELKDRDMKKILTQNFLNFRIHCAYQKHAKKSKHVRVNDILNTLTKDDSSLSRHNVLSRILSLAYYHNWPLIKDENAIDTDYFIEIPENFRKKPKQRFNIDVFLEISDDDRVLFFINTKGDLVLVLKDYSQFNKDVVKKHINKYLKKEFNIKKITYQE